MFDFLWRLLGREKYVFGDNTLWLNGFTLEDVPETVDLLKEENDEVEFVVILRWSKCLKKVRAR